jgi:hypothetical protein
MSDTFTPGTWVSGFCDNPYMDTAYEISVGDQSIAGVWLEKDAHLIKAAPKLYQALENLITFGQKQGLNDGCPSEFKKAYRALKEARGEA